MTRSALPQNWQKSTQTGIGVFKSMSGWTKSTAGETVIEVNNSYYMSGGTSLRFHSPASPCVGWVPINITFGVAPNLSMRVYRPAGIATTPTITVLFSSSVDLAPYFYQLVPISYEGWGTYYLPSNNWTAGGGTNDWGVAQRGFKIAASNATAISSDVYIDEIYYNRNEIPTLILSFDDGYSSQYTVAYPYMAARGIPGTCYVVKDYVVAGASLTLAQCQTMYAAGWDICNHSTSHAYFDGLTDEAAGDEYTECQEWLSESGFNRSKDYFAWPGGLYTDAKISIIQSLGCNTARWTSGYHYSHPEGRGMCLLPGMRFSCLDSLATMKTYIDNAKRYGTSICIYMHDIVESPSGASQTSIANFQALIDYVVDSRIKTVTASEWYNGMTNPRYRSLPPTR